MQVPAVPGKYFDLKNSFLYMKVKIKKSDNTDLINTNDVAPNNLFGATMFSDVSLYINGVLVSCTANYHYLSHFKTLLSFPPEFKNNQLQNSVYLFDDSPKTLGEVNSSYKARKVLAQESKVFEIASSIYDDIFCCDRYIFSNVSLKVILKRCAPELCLVSTADTPNYKVLLEHCVLNLRKVDVAQNIYSAHEKRFQQSQLSYPYVKSAVRVAHFATGTANASVENIFNSQTLPHILCVGFTTTAAYNGAQTKNCLSFERNGVTSIQVQVNGLPCDYGSLSINDKQYLLAVEYLYKNLNLGTQSLGINRTNWITGNGVYVFKLYPNEQNAFSRTGNLSINISFGSGLAENITLVAVGQSPSVLSLSARGIETSNTLT